MNSELFLGEKFMSYIKSNSKVECPDKMYKYFGNLKYAFDSIKNDSIHFDVVNSFNDPFECYNELLYISDPKYFNMISFYVLKKELIYKDGNIQSPELKNKIKEIRNFDIYNAIMNYLNTNSDFIEQDANGFPYKKSKHDLFVHLYKQVKDSPESILRMRKELIVNYFCEKWNLQKFSQRMIDKLTQDNSGKIKMQDQGIKVSCFSERNDSILMWAYYANSHKGICVEYDFSDKENKRRVGRVLYKKLRNFNSNNWYRIKANCWRHEREWRMAQIPPIYDTRVAVRNIYFGVNYDYANDEYYHQIVKCAKYRGIGMYRAIQSQNDYEIDFIPLFKV